MKDQVNTFIISKELADAILNYLVKRPYLEVNDLIQGLYTMPPCTVETKDIKDPPEKPGEKETKKE